MDQPLDGSSKTGLPVERRDSRDPNQAHPPIGPVSMITDEHRKHVVAMMDAYGVPNLIAHDLVGIVHPNKAEMMENILNPIH